MSIRTLALFGVIAIALGLGVATAVSGSLRMAGWIALGIVPFTLASLSLVERLRGREIWHYPAPYPYRWMRRTEAEGPPTSTGMVHDDLREHDGAHQAA